MTIKLTLKEILINARKAINENRLQCQHPLPSQMCRYITDDGYRCVIGASFSMEEAKYFNSIGSINMLLYTDANNKMPLVSCPEMERIKIEKLQSLHDCATDIDDHAIYMNNFMKYFEELEKEYLNY